MGIITPSSASEEQQKILQDVKAALPKTNPWLNGSLIKSNPIGLGNRAYDYYYVLKQAVKQCFPFEAMDEFLQFWGTLKNMLPYTSKQSGGAVTWTGTVGESVDVGTTWKIGALEYTVDSTVLVEVNERSIVSLTADGLTGVCVTSGECNLRDGMSVVISGVDQAQWNGTWDDITVTGENIFTFVIPSGMPTPATGTAMIVSFDAALGNVTSVEKGADLNQTGGTLLIAETPATGIDEEAGCQFFGLTDGRDDETPAEYQTRIVESWQKPQTPANPNRIESIVKAIPGNTRVWAHRVTPEVGDATVYFVRDNDDSIIPDASSVAETKDAVFNAFAAQTAEENIYVNDPLTGIEINSAISNIVPATSSMKTAVKATIRTYFRGSIGEGEDFLKDNLKSAITQTYDSVGKTKITSFTMDSPNVDSAVAIGQIAIEGTTTTS